MVIQKYEETETVTKKLRADIIEKSENENGGIPVNVH